MNDQSIVPDLRPELAAGANPEPALPSAFPWPGGKRAAVSLSFDDARLSQVDAGFAILDRYGIKATFYLSPPNVEPRLEAWRSAAAHGHEMGNHTLTHPCSGNFTWSRANALEECTLEQIEQEINGASATIRELLSVTPLTFAYPCGQKFVGRGEFLQSYVPVVSRHFVAGRGFRDETINSPAFCDLAQVMGVDGDAQDFEVLQAWIDRAAQEGGWLVLCSHEVGDFPRQAMPIDVLDALCRYCADAENGVWIDTVAAVATYIRQQRDRQTSEAVERTAMTEEMA
jgi:peptidoglycan/xylan/chitin deacetylase (PgdA/CDA1 family)